MEIGGITDELTGLYSRGYFVHRLAEEVERVRRYGGALTVAVMELDHYRQMVERDGARKADSALQGAARALARRTRISDIRARWEEGSFIMACAGTNLAQACWLAEALRDLMAELPSSTSLPANCSFGVVEMDESDTAESLIRRVGEVLEEARSTGGNTVAC